LLMRIILIGFGTVGQGFAQLLLEKSNYLWKEFGLEWKITSIVDPKYGNIADESGIDVKMALEVARKGGKFSEYNLPLSDKSVEEIVAEQNYDVMVELTPTNLQTGEPATGIIRLALTTGHHVITTNKGPCALFLNELKQLAGENGVLFKCEGTVMSGTPLINFIENNLKGLEIKKVEGILNGTCNFILTCMEEGMSYDEALQKAQRLGYAEADPGADVEGWDSVAKLLILAQVIYRVKIPISAVKRRGIVNLTSEDINLARGELKTWKLIASLEKTDNDIVAMVEPRKISLDHPLSKVRGALNAVTFETDCLGNLTIIGPGAGGRETGFAVLSDLISIYKSTK